MALYGSVPTGNKVIGEFRAKKAGLYEFKLYPQLWSSPDLATYYSGRKWDVVSFVSPQPAALPTSSGIYMFVVGPYCGGLRDHSYIFYVGKTNNIRKRYANYLREKDGRVTNPREDIVMMLNDFDGYLHFHYTLVPEDELTQAESLLKDNLTPVANAQLELKGRLSK
jgi:hypothetical protein